MPEFQDYTDKSAHEVDGDDITLLLIDGVTHKMTADELAKRGNTAVVNSQSGTSYTLLIGDMGKTIDMSNAGANTLTVPPDLSFPNGTRIEVCRIGAGVTTIVAGSGVTIYTANDDLTIASQFSSGLLRKIGTNIWLWQGAGTASGGGGGADVTAPTVVSAETTDATHIEVVFSESVTVTTAGWSFTKNGSNLAITSVSGSGTTWTFLVASMSSGDDILMSYNSGTGATVDGSSNELVSFTDDVVDNTIGVVALNPPGSFNAVQDGSDVDLTWTDTNTSPNETGFEIRRNTSNTTVGSTLINSPASGATSYTDVAPGAGTWYYFIKAIAGVGASNSSNASDSVTVTGGGYEAESLAYFAEFLAQEGSAMSTPDKDAYNDFVVAAKAAGIYSNFQFIFPLKGATANGMKINAVTPSNVLTYTGTFTYTSMGLKHDGVSTSRAATTFTPTTLGATNDVHIGCYITEDAGGYLMGAAGLEFAIVPPTLYSTNQELTDNTTGGQTDSLGHTCDTRVAGPDYYMVRRGVSATKTQASVGTGSQLVALLNTGGSNAGTAARMGFAHGGFGLTSAEAIVLEGLIEDLMTAWGRNV